ncbi:hypothetical protein J1614_004301 [Plenodomus biglobosus]|nr:hypothetical protein J1614_004301 [Plenodomus biglobosus]
MHPHLVALLQTRAMRASTPRPPRPAGPYAPGLALSAQQQSSNIPIHFSINSTMADAIPLHGEPVGKIRFSASIVSSLL